MLSEMFSEEMQRFSKIALSTTVLSLRELFWRIKTPSSFSDEALFRFTPQYEASSFHSDMKHSAHAPYDEKMKNESCVCKYSLSMLYYSAERKILMEKSSNKLVDLSVTFAIEIQNLKWPIAAEHLSNGIFDKTTSFLNFCSCISLLCMINYSQTECVLHFRRQIEV